MPAATRRRRQHRIVMLQDILALRVDAGPIDADHARRTGFAPGDAEGGHDRAPRQGKKRRSN
jgi:hypothetical protein